MDDAPRILGGRYEVGELIGRGGMAEVHIGHDTRLGRTVAVKILRSDLARDPSFQARFRREAQAAASLNHPAIVAVYDTGEDLFTEPTGSVQHVPFIVMEYVEGHTVRDILRDGNAVPIEEAVEITSGVLSALEYSHQAGIVHRDIKPANVMLTPTGAVKVMDFGIARAMADAAGTMTQTQAVIGTAQYLSPEQARGEAVDTRSDLYSTGCLLFELLTGRPPFIGDSPVAVAYQHARELAPPPSTVASDVPDALDRITVKSLAKDREDRYPTAAEFRHELEAAVRGGHVAAPPVHVLGAGAGAATAVLDQGPPTASTQVMGATGGTQVMGAQPGPWDQVTGQQPAVPPPGATAPEEPRSRKGLLWTLIVLGLLAIAGIALVLALGNRETAEQVQVPDVVGLPQAEARALIEAEGLVYTPRTEGADAEEGTVVSTNPPAGEEVDEGSEVVVTISAGPESVTIPQMENFTQAQARAQLEQLGLTVESTENQDHPTVAEGNVIGTDPPADTAVPRGSSVVLVLSTGLVELEDLTGMTEQQARDALTALSLVPEVTTEESDEDPGTVIRQSRAPGPVPQRSTVGLVVATERAPEQVPVPEVFNLTEERARETLGASNLNVGETAFEPSDDVAEGRVIRSEPGAGTPVDEGATVRLVVSSGPEETEEPAPPADPPGPGGEGPPGQGDEDD